MSHNFKHIKADLSRKKKKKRKKENCVAICNLNLLHDGDPLSLNAVKYKIRNIVS